MDPELQAAHDARVPYLEPQSLFDPDGRRVRVPSTVPLHESYETQQHVIQLADHRVVWRPGALLPPPLPTSFEPIMFWLLSAWNPSGTPSTVTDNLARNVALGEAIAEAGGEVRDVVATVPPERSWVEDTLLFRGLPPEAVVELAVRFEQPTLTAMGMDSITIVPTGLSHDVHLVTLECDEFSVPLTCPMRGDDVPGARCTIRGGPWISASIHAASIWTAHRGLLLERLGCTPCENGTQPALGPLARLRGPITFEEHLIASRYGGYSWHWRPKIV